ncbi:aspartate aminotransferase family protein [candidate division KSB1 bacterium]|nr:aspartate aminotransferase family protein [candidate division KSB1 bacterium]MBL7095538.1 aspartate aminotransferase family protein [candidate division KSB1 bacterium]
MNPKETATTLFANHVSSGKVNFFKTAGIDFVLGKREGPYLWDLAGEKKVIDCHCNGGVFNLGHRNPEIIKTLTQSLQELDIGNHHLISDLRAVLAQKLAELAPGDLAYTVFGVGGGEAIDLAIKVARAFTGKDKIISAKGGYHGHTGFALAAGDEKWRKPFGVMAPGFLQIPFNDFEAFEKAVEKNVAAVLLETIPATCGISIPGKEYLLNVRKLCSEKEIILIIDEVQSGLGRTGKLWAIEHFDVEPDMMVIGKGLSGGIYPMAATCFKDKYESVFHEDPFIHVSTFGGAEVGCPVALKVLEISSNLEFLKNVEETAIVFSEGFEELKAKHPQILVGLRQSGLMMGIEMVNEHCGPIFTKAAFDAGLLSVYAANDPRVAQLLPPLTIDRTLAGEILFRIDKALTGVKGFLGL